MIYAIWAEDEAKAIGVEGHLPWRLPAELEHFKNTTYHQAILMGRKTFEGMNKRVLPGRISIVLTRDTSYPKEDNDRVLIMHSVSEVLEWYNSQDRDLYIIGGAKMFLLFEKKISALYKTIVHEKFTADTYFPEDFDFSQYEKISEDYREKDEKNIYDFTIEKYERKEKHRP
ncbi:MULTISPECIES: dihydrofolate reductase [Lactococcus]|uniref:dihydrofolate reductase n=1 Tax=Lactococcus TaxID=1357 RepID=UPI0020425275|nr:MULTISPECIES: dihydrofolate reductase [Lactococcus]